MNPQMPQAQQPQAGHTPQMPQAPQAPQMPQTPQQTPQPMLQQNQTVLRQPGYQLQQQPAQGQQQPRPIPTQQQPQPIPQPTVQLPQQQMRQPYPTNGGQPMQPSIATKTPVAPALPTPPAPDKKDATQTTLLLSEIRDGLVIMKDGSFRAVVACKSINFDLMSETEREGIEYSYQGFLNSLNFTTQILVRSQRVDIGPYLERLTEIRKNNDNMLLGVLMDDYINFVDILSQEANIMDKSFFIIVPYYSDADTEKAATQPKNIFSGLFGSKSTQVTRIDRATYDKAITEINNRVEAVVSGLFQIGVHAVRLNTKELSELYYNFNNPDTAVREPFIDFNKMATTYVKKGEKNA